MSSRLSALDASFLAVESPTAHMHVGWVAVFSAPAGGRLPSFAEIRRHIDARLGRAPRYRQKLAPVPLGLRAPEWVDDPAFRIDRHLYWAPGPLEQLVDEVMSMPLRRDRPLWEMWVCEDQDEGWIAIVGKAHHCMVDGLAAVELGSLLLDVTPEPAGHEPPGREPTGHEPPGHELPDRELPGREPPGYEPPGRELLGREQDEWGAEPEPEGWYPPPEPSGERLLVRGLRELAAQQLRLLAAPVRGLASPAKSARAAAAGSLRAARALNHSLRGTPASALNTPLSPLRRLAWVQRPLGDLQAIKRAYGTTVNDVVLAAVAGGMRSYLARHDEPPVALKTMVPVSVRAPEDVLGNRISFVFIELPCEEPDPVARLYDVHASMSRRKRYGEPQGADLVLKAAGQTPTIVQHAISRIVSSPRAFNLVVSNIPGAPQQMYMLGCPLQATYPVVPLADRHAVSVGMTTTAGRACFGVYTDRLRLPDAHVLARDIDDSLQELLLASRRLPAAGRSAAGRPAGRRAHAARA
jgi:diacylglycerol O-acyltransferase